MFSIFSHFIFGNSSALRSRNGPNNQDRAGPSHGRSTHHKSTIKSSSWEDKTLCFDLKSHDIDLSKGEQLIGCFYPIEDVKGNLDEHGLLKITNLRLIWICCRKKRVNLSIGWRTVSLIYEQNLKDNLGETKTNLFVLTKYESTKYEFVFNKQALIEEISPLQMIWNSDGTLSSKTRSIFERGALNQFKKYCSEKSTHVSVISPDYLDDPFEVVMKVWQAYKQTMLFRHCRSNLPNIIKSSEKTDSPSVDAQPINVDKLPSEEIIETFKGIVHSESRSIKFPGTLILSNIRIIWIDDSIPVRNLSIPYIRIESIKFKQSEKIIISTHDYIGSSTTADFRLQKQASKHYIRTVYEQISNLYSLHRSRPRYGPESCDDSLNYIAHLRPVEYLFAGLQDDSFMASIVNRDLDNFGPEANRSDRSVLRQDENIIINDPNENKARQNANDVMNEDDDEQDDIENDFGKSRIDSYLNERPLNRDAELIYSEELGLTIEKPKNNSADLKSIWMIGDAI